MKNKSKSFLYAVICFTIYFMQAILYSLLKGSFSMKNDTATIVSNLTALLLVVLLIRNKKRAKYFGFNSVKVDGNPLFLLPLLIVPMINLLYIFTPGISAKQSILISIFIGFYIGIMEELIFRGFLFRAIEERFNGKTAIIISSIIFGLYHFVNLTVAPIELVVLQVAYSTAIGVSFAIVFYLTKSLFPCIIIHMLTNIIAFLFEKDTQIEFEIIGVVITVLLAVFYSVMYSKNNKKPAY